MSPRAGLGGRVPQQPAAPTGSVSPIASASGSAAPPAPPPGLWLAAFQNAVSGDGAAGAKQALTDDASSKEGE